MMTGAEWPLGCTLNPGLRVPDSGLSGFSGFCNPGGDPTKLAAVGGGKKLSSNELCKLPGTARFNSSIMNKVESVDGALSSSCKYRKEDVF